jgi:hypothetical protein
VELPDLPFEEFQVCFFQRWRTGEIAYTILSLVYGMFCSPPSVSKSQRHNTPFVLDTSAFLVVVYTARNRRGFWRPSGVPSIFDNIVQGATTYFLVICTGNLLVIFFELLAPVSDLFTNPLFSAHCIQEPIQLLPAR